MKVSLHKAGEMLLEANKIVITAHENPDGDAIGSSLGLMYYLCSKGKNVRVWIDDDVPRLYNFIDDVKNIERPVQIDEDVDLLVVLDASLDRIGKVKSYLPNVTVLNIDHHVSNDGKAEYLYLDSNRAATAEIIYELLILLKANISQKMAIAIYTGLATDTGFFKYSNTLPYTMRAAAELISFGAKPHVISEALEEKSFSVVKGLAAALQTIDISEDGKIAGMYLSQKELEQIDSTEGFIDFVRTIEGVEVAVLVKNIEKGISRVSMRSKGFNVSEVALSLGGGGHIRAAGCTIKKDLQETKNLILAKLKEAMRRSK